MQTVRQCLEICMICFKIVNFSSPVDGFAVPQASNVDIKPFCILRRENYLLPFSS